MPGTPLPISVTFEMTDAVAERAARESWLGFGRRLFTLPALGIIALSAAIFVLALRGSPHPVWLLVSGAGPAGFVLLALAWTGGLWWVQRAMRQRLAHLPHRQVVIDLTETEFAVQTATEQVRLHWSEIKELRFLPSFLVFRLRGGGEIPVPLTALPSETLTAIRSKVSS